MNILHRFVAWFRRRNVDLVHVMLIMESGTPVTLGPMDPFAAEVLLVNVINPNPYHVGRRVTRARIIR